jgi:hypothetical protein
VASERTHAGTSDGRANKVRTADVLIEQLSRLSRAAGSAGEHRAAEALGAALARRGAHVRIEPVRVHGTYWQPLGIATATGALAALAPPGLAALGGIVGAAAAADDLEIGRRPLRRVLRQRTAYNVIAEYGPEYGPDRGRDTRVPTLVVHAHHDAAHTGAVFHPALARLRGRLAGRMLERIGGTLPPLWGAVAGPIAVAAGALAESRRLRALGALVSGAYAVAMADIARRPTVPGANDNLSGVYCLLRLADSLSRRPPNHLRVILLSTGSEESFLEAMQAFARVHFDALPRETTTFLCLESVGSPRLMLLAGEGLLRLHRYPRDLIAALTRIAEANRVPLRAPFRYRLATDGQVPLRSGYPAAVISSMAWCKAPSNYHWPSDIPANLDLASMSGAARIAEGFLRELDAAAAGSPEERYAVAAGAAAPTTAVTAARRVPSPLGAERVRQATNPSGRTSTAPADPIS